MTEAEKLKRAKAAAQALAAKRGYLSPTGLSPLAKRMFAEIPEDELKKIAAMRGRRLPDPKRKMRGGPKRTMHKVRELFEDDLLIDLIADMITDDPDVFED
jgi:hypothetical protein